MIEQHLAQAEGHVSQGDQHIEQQKALIIRMESGGHDTVEARRLLVQFEELQELHVTDRDRLLKELADCKE